MKTLITFLLVCTATVFIAQAHSTDPLDNRSSIEIKSLEKVPIVEVTLNGKTAYFVLDSGSDVSLLDSAEANDYGFFFQKRATRSIVGASGGNQSLYQATGVNLQIDRQPLQTAFYATDLSPVIESLSNSTGIAISGIIGMDLMRKYGFEIDYLAQKLTLHLSS